MGDPCPVMTPPTNCETGDWICDPCFVKCGEKITVQCKRAVIKPATNGGTCTISLIKQDLCNGKQ